MDGYESDEILWQNLNLTDDFVLEENLMKLILQTVTACKNHKVGLPEI